MHWAALLAAVAAIGLYGASQAPDQMQKAPEAKQPLAPKTAGSSKAPPASVEMPPKLHAAPQAPQPDDKGGIELGSWPDWVIVAFTAFLALLSWRQHLLEKRLASETSDSMHVARDSASAAKEAAEATNRFAVAAEVANRIHQETAQVDQRAWVEIESVVPASGLKWDPQDGGRIRFIVNTRNVGRTPAKSVAVSVELHVNTTAWPKAKMEARMAEIAKARGGMGTIVFPDRPHVEDHSIAIDPGMLAAMETNVDREWRKDGEGWLRGILFPQVIVIASYATIFSEERRFTAMIFNMAKRNDPRGEAFHAFEDVDHENIGITRWFFDDMVVT